MWVVDNRISTVFRIGILKCLSLGLLSQEEASATELLTKQLLSPVNSCQEEICITSSKINDNLLGSRKILETRIHRPTLGVGGKCGVKLTGNTENMTLALKCINQHQLKQFTRWKIYIEPLMQPELSSSIKGLCKRKKLIGPIWWAILEIQDFWSTRKAAKGMEIKWVIHTGIIQPAQNTLITAFWIGTLTLL